MIDIYEKILDDTYKAMLKTIQVRYEKPGFKFSELKCELESLYKYDGLGIDRSEAKQAEVDGTILAYETFISRHEKDSSSAS